MAKVTFKPLGARVLIEAVEQEEITAGGIPNKVKYWLPALASAMTKANALQWM
jgi:hypothetical protein